MRLLFKQRFLSWFDSYDIYDEEGRTAYTVEGKLSWGHRLEIYGPAGDHLGTVKEEVLTLLPRFTPGLHWTATAGRWRAAFWSGTTPSPTRRGAQ